MESDLFLGDCLDVMQGMQERSVDAIVTDPPYLHLHGSSVRKPYFVRCGLCGHIGPKAYSEKESVDRWNAERKSDTKKGNKQ